MSDQEPLVLVTGFGAFLDVDDNPSGQLAERLAADPPAGLRVRHRVLPVSFEGVPRELAGFIAEEESRAPAFMLSLGVHRGRAFRFEQNAQREPTAGRPDNDGHDGSGLQSDKPRATSVDVPALTRRLSDFALGRGLGIEISSDAGGYVCDWTYQHLLRFAEHFKVPALFLHVPPVTEFAVDEQLPFVRALLPELLRD